jgi:hypothetical protein
MYNLLEETAVWHNNSILVYLSGQSVVFSKEVVSPMFTGKVLRMNVTMARSMATCQRKYLNK